MAINKERKEELVAQYVELLNNSQGFVMTENRGMKMTDFDALRAKMRDIGSTYIVTKNTLLRIALEEVGLPVPVDLLKGPVAVAFAHQDLAATAKAVLDFNEDVELFMVKGAMAGEAIFADEAQVDQLSKLPTMDELRANILGLLVAPMSGLVGVLAAPSSELVSVINGGATQLLNVIAAYANKQDAA